MKKGLNVVRNEGVSGVVKRMQDMSEVDSSAKHIKDAAKLGQESLSNKNLSGGIKGAAKTISGKASSGIGGIKGAYKSGGPKGAGKYAIDEVVDAGKAGISGIRGAYQAGKVSYQTGGIRNTIDSAKGGIKNAGKSVNMANVKKYGGNIVSEVKGMNAKSLMGFLIGHCFHLLSNPIHLELHLITNSMLLQLFLVYPPIFLELHLITNPMLLQVPRLFH